MRDVLKYGMLIGATLLVGCEGSTEPDEDDVVPTSELTFIELESTITVPTRDTSFVVTAGQDFRLELLTDPEPGEDDGEEFFEFELDEESLLRRPDGTLFQDGDTITITVHIPGDEFVAYMEPSGLVFNPNDPAELKWTYGDCDDDLDDDGDVDEDDTEFEEILAIWRQDSPSDPWVRINGVHEPLENEIEIEVDHFTGFALAGN